MSADAQLKPPAWRAFTRAAETLEADIAARPAVTEGDSPENRDLVALLGVLDQHVARIVAQVGMLQGKPPRPARVAAA